jgi:hypothetical protein
LRDFHVACFTSQEQPRIVRGTAKIVRPRIVNPRIVCGGESKQALSKIYKWFDHDQLNRVIRIHHVQRCTHFQARRGLRIT